MTEARLRTVTPTIDIYIKLAQFPILAERIRERMRHELFRRGIINPDQFELEVRDLAIDSQRREGLGDPFFEEDTHTWQQRLERIRDLHTDAYFANNLGSARLDTLIEDVLNSRPLAQDTIPISFNPEIAPWEMLFQQGEVYERMDPEELDRYRHHLEEIKVVLIKRLMSDQLPFIGVAKRVLTIDDLRRIYQNLIGTGKIGGKAAGIYLAWRILQPVDQAFGVINFPDSYFIGTDVIYEFFLMNQLEHYMNQKYRTIQEIRAEYPKIVDAFLAAELPDYLVTQLREVMQSLGNSPLVIRSSSLLEDNFGFAFAGKYNSYYCANQGTPEENLTAVLDAIRRIYASSVNPDALLYRMRHNLIDYDERMAILLQRATGRWCGRYFYPDIAGVGFSQNPFCWSPEIRPGEGFLRFVAGLGSRAVDRISQDYPRLVPLSHPHLRPEDSLEAKRNYAQRFMAVIDRQENRVVTVPVREGLGNCSSLLPLVASLDLGDRLMPVPEGTELQPDDHIVMTFEGLTGDPAFVEIMSATLRQLQDAYQSPVDLEYAVLADVVLGPGGPQHVYQLFILECRPLYKRAHRRTAELAGPDLPPSDRRRLFSLPTLLTSGTVSEIEYLVFVEPDCYYNIADEAERWRVADTITALNDILPAGRFGVVGPGRWGSQNSRLSVPVTYSDICNSKLLIEISPVYAPAPELAYGTDFFEDVVEAGIFILGIQPDHGDGFMDWALLRDSPNQISRFLAETAQLDPSDGRGCVRVIDLRAVAGSPLKLVVANKQDDDHSNEAIACFDIP